MLNLPLSMVDSNNSTDIDSGFQQGRDFSSIFGWYNSNPDHLDVSSLVAFCIVAVCSSVSSGVDLLLKRVHANEDTSIYAMEERAVCFFKIMCRAR